MINIGTPLKIKKDLIYYILIFKSKKNLIFMFKAMNKKKQIDIIQIK